MVRQSVDFVGFIAIKELTLVGKKDTFLNRADVRGPKLGCIHGRMNGSKVGPIQWSLQLIIHALKELKNIKMGIQTKINIFRQ